MSKKYIAYGSNLSVEQMAFRCPEAKIIGMAAIQNWKLVFRTHATIEPAVGRVVPVLIWEITDRDEKNLDLYEGFPSYYFKQDMTVTMTDLDGKNPQEITSVKTSFTSAAGPPAKEAYSKQASERRRL